MLVTCALLLAIFRTADILFDSFASGGRVSTDRFFEVPENDVTPGQTFNNSSAEGMFDAVYDSPPPPPPTHTQTLWNCGILRTDPRIKGCYALLSKLQDADGAVNRSFVSFILKAIQGRFVIPDFSTFTEETQKLFIKCKQLSSVKVCDFISALLYWACSYPGKWGISICTVDGQRCGGTIAYFEISNVCWALVYGLAVDQLGVDYVHRYVGVEEYAKYDSPFTLNEQGKNNRPYAQPHTCFPEGVDINATLDLLLQCLSTEVTCESGAALAATLANGGLCPMSGDQVLSPTAVRSALSLMQVAGMNNYSRVFHFKTSVPAKSSSSGVMLVVVPGVLGLICWSPELDAHGNSWRGVHFCEVNPKLDGRKHLPLSLPQGYQIMNVLLAAYRGDLHSLRRHFLSGADVNAVDYDGRSALHVAASEGRLEVISFLVENAGADCTWGNTALQEALRCNQGPATHRLKKYTNNEKSL
uniref:glutaminase n=1 Tax=Electrophorus electricus TaxID=8005 RepID=A0A4W4H6G4_ELEEL